MLIMNGVLEKWQLLEKLKLSQLLYQVNVFYLCRSINVLDKETLIIVELAFFFSSLVGKYLIIHKM